jgi:hypothetical protein
VRYFILFFAVIAVTSACTTKIPQGQPLPELTYQHLKPYALQASRITIDNQYSPVTDPQDMSSSFPTPPDIAVRRYLENRFEAGGTGNEIVFSIEEAYVYQRVEGQTGGLSALFGNRGKEVYDMMTKVRFYQRNALKEEGQSTTLTFERSLNLPQNYSLVQKEKAKLEFLESFIKSVDVAMLEAIESQGMMVFADESSARAPLQLLTTPKSGR